MKEKPKYIHIKCDDNYHKAVSRSARKLGLTISDYVRACIKRGEKGVARAIKAEEGGGMKIPQELRQWDHMVFGAATKAELLLELDDAAVIEFGRILRSAILDTQPTVKDSLPVDPITRIKTAQAAKLKADSEAQKASSELAEAISELRGTLGEDICALLCGGAEVSAEDAGEDMSDWREGDIIKRIKGGAPMCPVGSTCTFLRMSPGVSDRDRLQLWYKNEEGRDAWCWADLENFRWHSRP